MTETKYKAPEVYAAIAKILSELSVEKNGTLPSNMGGKGYITAVDLNSEIKRKFVENNLIYLPTERVVTHEVTLTSNQKTIVTISVEGHYTIISTVDGSSVEVGASGDGLATGSAVASNIASTNALKNALLRTFLVTEQSVEDQGKEGVKTETAPTKPAESSERDDIKAWLTEHSKAVPGDLKGSKYLGLLVDSGEFGGRSFLEVWRNGDVDDFRKLKAAFESQQASK